MYVLWSAQYSCTKIVQILWSSSPISCYSSCADREIPPSIRCFCGTHPEQVSYKSWQSLLFLCQCALLNHLQLTWIIILVKVIWLNRPKFSHKPLLLPHHSIQYVRAPFAPDAVNPEEPLPERSQFYGYCIRFRIIFPHALYRTRRYSTPSAAVDRGDT